MKRFHKLGVLALGLAALLPINITYASKAAPKNSQNQFTANHSFSNQTVVDNASYIPRLYLAGFGGYDGWTALGQADILAPIMQRYNLNLFIYGQGRYGAKNSSTVDNPWTGSIGLGYRQIVGRSVMFGAYVLGDYSAVGYSNYVKNSKTGKYEESSSSNKVFMVSPGLELMTQNWEFRLNGYLPVLTKHNWTESAWASDQGVYKYIVQEGHDIYDAKFTYTEEAGMGTDAEVGRKLFILWHTLVKGYVNGYYFKMEHNKDVMGGGVRFTVQPTNYLDFSVRGSYDNYNHSVVMAGMQVDIYNMIFNRHALNTSNLQSHLFAPIERNFGTIASASSARIAGAPGERYTVYTVDAPTPYDPNEPHNPHNPINHHYLKNDNVWYFGAPATYFNGRRQKGDLGTFSNPYSAADLNEATLQHIAAYNKAQGLDHSELYVGPGTYSAVGNMALYNRFSIFGVEADLKTPAQEAGRPVLTGEFSLFSNDTLENVDVTDNGVKGAGITLTGSNITVQNVNLTKSGSDTIGIAANNGSNITINHVNIGVAGGTAGYATGISLDNVNGAAISNSNIYGPGNIGIKADSGTDNLTLDSVTVGSSATAKPNGVADYKTGLSLNGVATTTVKNSNIYAYANGSDATTNAAGINMTGGGELTLSDSTVYAQATATSTAANVGNAYGIHADGHSETLNVDGSTVTAIGQGDGSDAANGYGILVGENVAVSGSDILTKNNINISSSTISGAGTLEFSESNNDINSGNGYGVMLGYGDVVNTDNAAIKNNTITINGDSAILGSGLITSKFQAYRGTFTASANGVGLGVGDNYVSASKGDLSISGNTIQVGTQSQDSDSGQVVISGSGKVIPKNGPIDLDTSGNGIGVMVGYNDANVTVGGTANLSIGAAVAAGSYSNQITISNSKITGSGNSGSLDTAGTQQTSGDGFGVLLGYNQTSNLKSSSASSFISGNQLDINAGTTIDSQASGVDGVQNADRVGVLFGYLLSSTSGDGAYLSNNLIDIENSTINTAVPSGKGGENSSSYGVLLDTITAYAAVQSPANGTTLTVNSTAFNINSALGTSYGIWVPKDSGVSMNSNIITAGNNIFKTDAIKGYEIMDGPTGNVTNWVRKSIQNSN